MKNQMAPEVVPCSIAPPYSAILRNRLNFRKREATRLPEGVAAAMPPLVPTLVVTLLLRVKLPAVPVVLDVTVKEVALVLLSHGGVVTWVFATVPDPKQIGR